MTMRDHRRLILAFLLIMLTSIFAGWRQCRMMPTKPPQPDGHWIIGCMFDRPLSLKQVRIFLEEDHVDP